jgi:putative addiction module component (TIGR02574 family)
MGSSHTSVFELSFAEKLQLVEDLWDDIAYDAKDVPIHDWQKEELDRRKRNLLRHTGSALSWKEIREKIRNSYER